MLKLVRIPTILAYIRIEQLATITGQYSRISACITEATLLPNNGVYWQPFLDQKCSHYLTTASFAAVPILNEGVGGGIGRYSTNISVLLGLTVSLRLAIILRW